MGVPREIAPLKGRGIGYDTSDKLLARLDGVTRLRSRKLFLMIGINDLTSGNTPGQVEANVGEIIRRVRQESPETEVFVQSVPRQRATVLPRERLRPADE